MEDIQRQLKEAMKKFDDQQKKLNAAPPEERNSPAAKKESQRLEGDVSRAYLMLASASSTGPRFQRASTPGTSGNDSDKALYESGMDALKRGEHEAARKSLQRLIERYPASAYATQATRAIAQSWDAEGTLALVHAEEQYQTAQMSAKPMGPGITAPVLIYQVNPEYTPKAKEA